MGKLILVRHGETSKNVKGRLHSTNDSEILNENGIAQMQKVADRLKEYSVFKIYCSKESRAVESADLLSKSLKIPKTIIDGLQERNWGEFSGKPWSTVQKVLDPMSLEERYTYVPKNGESWESFEKRLVGSIEKVIDKENTIVVVTHGGAIRALMPYLLRVPKEESFKYDPGNASLTIFDYDGENYNIETIDDSRHL